MSRFVKANLCHRIIDVAGDHIFRCGRPEDDDVHDPLSHRHGDPHPFDGWPPILAAGGSDTGGAE